MSCNYTCLKNLMCVLGVVEAQRKIPCAARWLWKVSFGARSVFAYGNGCPFLAYGYCVGFRPLATVLSGIYVINFLNLVHPCDCPFEPEVLHDMAGNSMAVRSIMAAICAAISATEPQLMSHNDFVWKTLKNSFALQVLELIIAVKALCPCHIEVCWTFLNAFNVDACSFQCRCGMLSISYWWLKSNGQN